jgi:hypothetical protein
MTGPVLTTLINTYDLNYIDMLVSTPLSPMHGGLLAFMDALNPRINSLLAN